VKASDSEPKTDGGTTEQTIDPDLFTRVSEKAQETRRDQARRAFGRTVVTPLRILMEDTRGIIGFTIVTGMVFMGTIGSWLAPESTQMKHPVIAPPFQSWEYPLGTNNFGNELHLELIHSTPAILKIVLAGAVLSVGLGTIVGTVAGYKSGRIDYVVMTLSDTWLAIPGLVLIIVVAEILDPRSPYIIGLILGINFWPGLARNIRSEVLSLREEAVIEAGRVMGLSDWRILRKYVISSLMPYISVNAATSAQGVIFSSVGLYYIGVLPTNSNPNWGVMMRDAFQEGSMTDLSQIHWLLLPMLCLSLLTLGLIFCGQALDRMFNVHLRARHADEEEKEEELDTNASAAAAY